MRVLRLSALALMAVACAAPLGATAATRAGGAASEAVTRVAIAVSAPQGSSLEIALPAPLTSVATLNGDGSSVQSAPPANRVTVSVHGDHLGLDVPAAAALGAKKLSMPGVGCATSGCGVHFLLDLTVTVRTPQASLDRPLDVVEPSADRLASALPRLGGGLTLQDEVWVTLGDPDSPGTAADALDVAQSVGAYLSGGLADIGVYQLRWATAQDLTGRVAQLTALPGVTSVAPATVGVAAETTSLPGELNKWPTTVTWRFEAVRAPEAWNLSTGGTVPVGILEPDAISTSHDDLNVVGSVSPSPIGDHATHVAGIACAKANGVGLVGYALGCPLISGGYSYSDTQAQLDLNVLHAGLDVAKRGAKVVNMSIGWNAPSRCTTQAAADAEKAAEAADLYMYKALFRGVYGKKIVWVVSAGNNCVSGVQSPQADLAAQLDNVITVASTNSGGHLSSFSDFGPGVEVAAPGGWGSDGTTGIVSTLPGNTYGAMVGTSMAAPAVAGIAALVIQAHPSFNADQIGRCITGFAGIGVGSANARDDTPLVTGYAVPQVPFSGSIPIVNAEAAVHCAQPTMTASAYNVGAGQNVTLTGASFSAQETVQLLLDGEVIGQAVVADDGTWSADVTIPAATTAGDHALKAVGAFSGSTVLTTLTVDPRGGTTALPGEFVFYDGNGNISLMNADGTNRRTVVNSVFGANASGFVWSPDGTKIAFASGNFYPPGIWMMNADGSNVHPVLADRGLGTAQVDLYIAPAAWSADGHALAIEHWHVEDGVQPDVVVINADGTDLRTVPNTTQLYVARWAPFSEITVQGPAGAAMLNDDGSAFHSVPAAPDGTAGVLSPDGKRLLYRLNYGQELWVENVDGSNAHLVASDPSQFGVVTWSPDSRWLALSPNATRSWFVVSASGGTMLPIDTGPGWSQQLAWGP